MAADLTWDDHQRFEREWWGDAINTFGEEAKQLTYAARMGLTNAPSAAKWPVYNLRGASCIDLGGGPASILLKCINLGAGTVVDPCPYPDWVRQRYELHGVQLEQVAAEQFGCLPHDEVWLYNTLQHVIDPEAVAATARNCGPLLRIFEWLEMPPSLGHPHTLHADQLNRWFGVNGTVTFVDENGATGLAYHGVFAL